LAETTEANEVAQSREPGAPKAERWALALVVALFCAWALAYLLHQPWGGGLDEPQHRNYLRVLAEEHRLPWLEREGGQWVRYRDAHAMHPPGYYLAVLPLYALVQHAPEPTIRLVMRLASIVLGGLTLLLAYPIVRKALGEDAQAALSATLIVALAPLYLLVSAIINNDIASVLVYCALLYLGVVRWQDALTWRRVVALGLLAGLAGLTKGTSEIAALGSGVYLVYTGCRGLGRRQAALRTAVFIGIAVALVAPWHARNLRLYGTLSYMPDDGKPVWLAMAPEGCPFLLSSEAPRAIHYVFRWQVNTLWAQMDWIPPWAQQPFFVTMWVLLGVGCAAILAAALRKRWRHLLPGRPWGALLSGAASLWAMATYIALFHHQGWARGGRYLLCALPAVACVMAFPLRLVPERLSTLRWGLVAILAGAGVLLNLVCYDFLVNVLIPHYRAGP
jgi:4-amino-4-deoxy-L-arabinose transferase-like glycosyltransferase